MSWLWAEGASPSCPSISPVWNLSYTKKYLELKIKNVIWESIIGTVKESDLLPIYLTCISHCQFSYGKNPPHLDNRYKANRFVRSNHAVKCSGLVPLCSLSLHWPGVGKFLISTLRRALFAKTHPAHVAFVKAVTGRAKPGSNFSKTVAIHCWCPRICCRAAASGIWYGAAGAFWAGPGQGYLCSPAPGTHALMKGMTEIHRQQL